MSEPKKILSPIRHKSAVRHHKDTSIYKGDFCLCWFVYYILNNGIFRKGEARSSYFELPAFVKQAEFALANHPGACRLWSLKSDIEVI